MPWRTDSVSESIRADVPAPLADGLSHETVMSWDDICACDEFRGRWVALDAAKYDACGRATEGQVVDADDDLQELCMRVREADRRSCAIVFCDDARRGSTAPN